MGTMRVDHLTTAAGIQAANWITSRIYQRTGDAKLIFPVDWMPATGICVYDADDTLLCVAILYLEKSSPVAVCGWCVTNPENASRTSRAAVKLAMSVLPVYAHEHGAKYLLTIFGNRGINRILDDLGYITTEDSENKFILTRGV